MTAPRTHDLRFTTYNIKNDLNDWDTLEDLGMVLSGTDVLVVQEFNHRRLQSLLDRIQPGVWWATQVLDSGVPGDAESRVAVAFRARRTVRGDGAWGWFVLHLSNLFPSADRTFTWAGFRDRLTGRRWKVGAVHLVPHADDADAPGRITPLPRRALVLKSIQRILGWVARMAGNVAIGGDFNVDLRGDLHRPDGLVERFRRAGLVTPPMVLRDVPRDTHGHNLYDQWWFRLGKGSRIVDHRVWPKGNSDHRAYTATVASTVRRGWRG